jgi:predicted phosphodiesterase
MARKKIHERLNALYENAPTIDISDESNIVIFSDFHIGSGGKMDDFAKNGAFFLHLLDHYYFTNDSSDSSSNTDCFTLILNGDVEELQRFHLDKVLKQWPDIYQRFGRLNEEKRLYKLVGNHDYHLRLKNEQPLDLPLEDALKLRYKENEIFVFHGHQAGRFSKFSNAVSGFVLRFLANPLRIKNYAVAFNNKKKYGIEQRVYQFARHKKVLALIGHTHRPLFESLSKIDSIRFTLERLCRIYPETPTPDRPRLEKRIKNLKTELERLIEKRKEYTGSLYASEPLVPCIFNSGCVIASSGITSIEISKGKIRLVYWFDKQKTRKYFDFEEYVPEQLGTGDYYRVILKEEPLDYIFTRVNLLT